MPYLSTEYLWLVICGAIASFVTAFAIGANDVANTFSAAVGSRALPLWLAIVLAGILETVGATLLGGTVTEKIKGSVINFQGFENNPSLLALGMLCALIGAGTWLLIASRVGLPVSTTHSIIGALLGFGLATGNLSNIRWNSIGFILISWIIAPLTSSLAGACIFLILRTFIMRKSNSLVRAYWAMPFFMFLVSTSFSFFIVFKNPFVADKECFMVNEGKEYTGTPCQLGYHAAAYPGIASGIALGISIVITVMLSLLMYRIAYLRVKAATDRDWHNLEPRRTSSSIPVFSDDQSSVQLSDSLETVLDYRKSRMDSDFHNQALHKADPQVEPSSPPTTLLSSSHTDSQPQSLSITIPQGLAYSERGSVEQQVNSVVGSTCPSSSAVSDSESVGGRRRLSAKVTDLSQTPCAITGVTVSSSISLVSETARASTVDLDPLKKPSWKQKVKSSAQDRWNNMPWFKDLHEDGCNDNDANTAHTGAELFDKNTELFFSCCQIVSSCLGCLAHSANDTANAIGPFAAILTIYYNGLDQNIQVEWYVLFAGGLSMALGLAVLGYRVIRTVGVKLVKITPSRGFSIELGAAWIVLLFSNFGVPLSTTHCAVGSTIGVGMMEPKAKTYGFWEGFRQRPISLPFINTGSVNWRLFGSIFISWIGTVVFSCIVSMALFAFAAYSPNVETPAPGVV